MKPELLVRQLVARARLRERQGPRPLSAGGAPGKASADPVERLELSGARLGFRRRPVRSRRWLEWR